MIVLAIHPGRHDASAVLFDDYRVLGAVQLERLSRKKGDGVQPDGWAWACADELLDMAGLTRHHIDAIALSRAAMPRQYYRKNQTAARRLLDGVLPGRQAKRPFRMMEQALQEAGTQDEQAVFDSASFLKDAGLRSDVVVHYSNHHLCHALPALFFTDWDEALIYTADGGGDNAFYSARSFRNGTLTELFGGDDLLFKAPYNDSLGLAYGVVTELLGFRMMRHEGKVTGLAAHGKPVFKEAMAKHFTIHPTGAITCDWPSLDAMREGIAAICAGGSKEDMACSVQDLLEDFILASVKTILATHPHRRLGVSGGVFANVKLNRLLAEHAGVDEIFVVPPMGDEGLSLGAGLNYLLHRDGLATWLENRYRLDSVYWGRDYSTQVDAVLAATPGVQKTSENPAKGTAERLTRGEIGAIYTGRMEFGPRALGARTILANPSRRDTHDELNRRLSRTEFMPFAPVVLAEKGDQVFDVTPVNAYACRFMTITTGVKEQWREKIAAVVHVDNSARPQLIRRDDNPLYHDILTAFEAASGLPVLVNTSFNVHEEPIVNAPAEAIRALTDGRVDFLVTDQGVYTRSA